MRARSTTTSVCKNKWAAQARAAEFARLFLVPGVDHGFRGPGAAPNMNRVLLSLIAWVEEGKVPDQLLGEARDSTGKVIRTRPIFPYPQTARYTGTGDPNDAQNLCRKRQVAENSRAIGNKTNVRLVPYF